MPKAILTPLASLRPLSHLIPAHGPHTPNTSLQQKPLFIYPSVFPPSSNPTASTIESHLTSIGVVTPKWRYTMYSTSHFHSTTHEVLGISSGRARLCFGHEDNPERVEYVANTGDVIVIPAGVSHRLLEELPGEGGKFEMVGCYPNGFNWDMCYGKPGEEAKVERIRKLAWFDRDPVYGDQGPVLNV